jgi:hypothetical protein
VSAFLAVGGGGAAGFDRTVGGGSAQLDLGVAPWRALLLRVAGAFAYSPTAVAEGGDASVRAVVVSVRLEAGARGDRGRLYGQALAGAGVGLVRSAPADIVDAALRAYPVVSASLAGGVRVLPWLGLRLEAAPTVFVQRARYQDGDGAAAAVIGTSPRVYVHFLFGPEIIISR